MRALHPGPRWQTSLRNMLQNIQESTRSEITQDEDGSSPLQSTQGDEDSSRRRDYAEEERRPGGATESEVGRPRDDERMEDEVPRLDV